MDIYCLATLISFVPVLVWSEPAAPTPPCSTVLRSSVGSTNSTASPQPIQSGAPPRLAPPFHWDTPGTGRGQGVARARAGWGAGWAARHPRPPVSPLPRVSSGRAGTQLCPAQPAARESSALSQLCGGRLAVCSPDLVQSTPAWVRIQYSRPVEPGPGPAWPCVSRPPGSPGPAAGGPHSCQPITPHTINTQ